MTMHLVSGATSLNTRKPKAKITKAKLEQYQRDLASRNKELKRQGRHSECMTLDQYIDYVTGKIKSTKKKSSGDLKINYKDSGISKFKSIESKGLAVAAKQEPIKYTGTLIKGLSQMHKSNLVPVLSEEEIHSIARMRR